MKLLSLILLRIFIASWFSNKNKMCKKTVLKKYQKTLQKMKEKPSFTLVKELLKLLREIGVGGLEQRSDRLCRDLENFNNSKERKVGL